MAITTITTEYENKHKYQFRLLQAAHNAKGEGCCVKLLSDNETEEYSCLIFFSEELEAVCYISAGDFIEKKEYPEYCIGSVRFENGVPEFRASFSSQKINSDITGYIYAVKTKTLISKNEFEALSSFLKDDKRFDLWAKNSGYKPFIRTYKTGSGLVKSTTF